MITGAVAGEGPDGRGGLRPTAGRGPAHAVALIDADMRSADSRRLPTVEAGTDFPGVLGGQVRIDDALVGTTMPNLIVLPGGIPRRAAETLHGGQPACPFEFLRRHFHYVIVDGAPLLKPRGRAAGGPDRWDNSRRSGGPHQA